MLNKNIKLRNSKFYKGNSSGSISSFRTVSMIPGDRNGLPDDSLYTLSPRYDSSEECRVSYSLASGGYYG